MAAELRDLADRHDEAAGVYVHVPFCSAVCPYCDFAVVRDDHRRHGAFVEALARELTGRREEAAALGPADTVYFGGGTPSALDAERLAGILERIDAAVELGDDRRIFLEANPEDVDRQSLAAWRALGVGTLSIGVQALDEDALRFLGRRHTAAEGVRAVEAALEAGFETVSFDLIYGLPDQDPHAWRRTLERAVALAPHHISCYQLTIEPRTPFARRAARGTLGTLADDDQAALFFLTHELLATRGYDGYEVSSFAVSPAHRSRHNRKYWHHVPYFGLGPSAHSFDGRRRRWNERHVGRWQRRLAETGEAGSGAEELDRPQLAFETLMLGLRTADGVDLAACRERFGIDLRAGNAATLARQVAGGRLDDRGDRLVPSLAGMAVADAIAAEWTVVGPTSVDRAGVERAAC